MGLFCKGLHCAGCGKGIPLGVVVALVVISMRSANAISSVLAEILIAVAAALVFAMVATPIVLFLLMQNRPVMGTRWEGPTMADIKSAAEPVEWPIRPALNERNPFLRIPVEVINDPCVDLER